RRVRQRVLRRRAHHLFPASYGLNKCDERLLLWLVILVFRLKAPIACASPCADFLMSRYNLTISWRLFAPRVASARYSLLLQTDANSMRRLRRSNGILSDDPKSLRFLSLTMP